MPSRIEQLLRCCRCASAVVVAAVVGHGVPAFAQDNPFKIGVLSDISGPVADLSGPGTVLAAKMAAEDFGGKVLGRSIQVLEADHQNKPDVGVGAARKWYDEGVNAIFDVGITTVALGVQQLAKEKNKTVIFISSASSDLTGKSCSPNGMNWTYDSFATANAMAKYFIDQKTKSWYFLTVDYVYGVNVQRDATTPIEASGGKILGTSKHPFDATDFSSDLLKAQTSGAEVIAIASIPAPIANIVKQSYEFGIQKKGQKLAPIGMNIVTVKALGLQLAQDLIDTEPFYWDQNDETRAFSKRFFERFKRMPTSPQAAAYGAVTHYLNAVKAVGSEDTEKVIAKMRETPINDFMTRNGRIREDGRIIRDMFVFRVKKPEQSKGEWDLLEQVSMIPGDQAFAPPDPVACSLVKK